jgi:hypothetical protein
MMIKSILEIAATNGFITTADYADKNRVHPRHEEAIPLAFAGINDLAAEIEALRSRVALLEAK